jgi:two-component system response regulator YesN
MTIIFFPVLKGVHMADWLRQKWSLIVISWLDKGRFFYRLISLGMISACIPIILAGMMYYQISVNDAYQKTEEESRISLTLIMDRVERIVTGIEQVSFQLALDPLTVNSVSDNQFREKYIAQRQLLDMFMLKKNANDLIAEIILYQNHSNALWTLEYGYLRVTDYKYKKDIDQSFNVSSKTQWLYLPQAQEKGFISFIRRLPLMSEKDPDGFLLFHIDAEMLKSYMKDSFYSIPDRSLRILDSEGGVIFRSDKPSQSEGAMNKNQNIEKIVHSRFKSGMFLAREVDGEEIIYSYQKTPSGRTYISLIPKEYISQQLSWIRWGTIGVALVFIAIGVVLSMIISMKAYSPIRQLMKHGRSLNLGHVKSSNRNEISYIKECLNYLDGETNRLSNYLRKLEPGMRERFFRKLLENGYADNSLLQKECTDLNIPIQGHYMVLVAEVENSHKEDRFLLEDKAIIGFAVANVMEELLKENKALNGYILNFNDGNGTAVISGNDLFMLVDETLKYAGLLCGAMRQYLKFKVSIGIGRVYTHIADVEVSYREALTALQYRLFRDSDPILYIEELENPKGKTGTYYPRKHEELIIAALMKGDIAEAERALIYFMQSVRQTKSYAFIYQSYHMLLSSVIQAIIQCTERQGGGILEVSENNLFDQLKERRTSNEIFDWFIEQCFPLIIKMTEQADQTQITKGHSDIMLICKYIRENIQSDISLTQCSELISMTPPYVSRLFKKVTGISFVDYVVQCKMEEAKRLMLETDYHIQEIANLIGYSERNLNRIFQRFTGLAPGQFRASLR